MARPAVRILAAALLLLAPVLLVAYRDGPLSAKTGGFGEETCRQCHFDNSINDPAGIVRLEGLPEAASPGQEYLIRVIVRRQGMARAGFELAVRFSDGSQAGALRAPDERTRAISAPDDSVQYIQHTAAGSLPTAGEARWTVLWTAPERQGLILFHAAANAANGDDSPLGDFIYTTTATIRRR
jgi:hypothetical protein